MSNYKILEEGKDNKVLVEWSREISMFFPEGKECSVHTVSLQDNLIWGTTSAKKKVQGNTLNNTSFKDC